MNLNLCLTVVFCYIYMCIFLFLIQYKTYFLLFNIFLKFYKIAFCTKKKIKTLTLTKLCTIQETN